MFSTPFVLTFSLLLSLPILFFLAPRILPPKPHSLPISPSDELDDINLFNRAITLANSRASTASATNPSKFFHLSSKNPSLKIAFLFLTNTDLHFSPLWDLFFHDTPSNLFNIYIHADPSVNITRPLSPLFANKFIPSKRTFRASPTLISATRRLLATALLDDPANAYFALLSQHCVPLHSFTYTYHSLLVSPTFDSSDPESSRLGIRLKYKSFIEILSHAPRLWKRYSSRGRYALMPEVEKVNEEIYEKIILLWLWLDGGVWFEEARIAHILYTLCFQITSLGTAQMRESDQNRKSQETGKQILSIFGQFLASPFSIRSLWNLAISTALFVHSGRNLNSIKEEVRPRNQFNHQHHHLIPETDLNPQISSIIQSTRGKSTISSLLLSTFSNNTPSSNNDTPTINVTVQSKKKTNFLQQPIQPPIGKGRKQERKSTREPPAAARTRLSMTGFWRVLILGGCVDFQDVWCGPGIGFSADVVASIDCVVAQKKVSTRGKIDVE
ncbi:uncharacterized protein HKW66_Vig0217430 [Vigna angularis]|uniref:Uncharacterized protein n=1 Tax=Phaseolus angularis TaxID=3914 RepID=A0A8T0JEI8_PHAAN|nr:uncharacterized protein HKW66_Vig0217430 [Vigna angularis]